MAYFLLFLIPFSLIIYLCVLLWCLADTLKEQRHLGWTVFLIMTPPVGPLFYFLNFPLCQLLDRKPFTTEWTERMKLRELEEKVREQGLFGDQADLAQRYFEFGRYEDCLKTLTPLIDREPEDLRLQFLAARVLYLSGKREESLAFFEFVVSERPDYEYGLALTWKGRVLEEKGEKEEALKTYHQMTKVSAVAEGYVRLARLLIESGNPNEAREHLTYLVDSHEEFSYYSPKRDRPWIKEARRLLKELPVTPN